MALIELDQITKRYQLGETAVEALCGIDEQIQQGEFLAIWGPSGSGKTSLLNIIGMIDFPSSGSIKFEGQDITHLPHTRLAVLRNQKIGFIFQNFNLIQVLNALENVMLPLQIQGVKDSTAKEKALARLEELGIGALSRARPDQMSGGQRQRVAIARALVTEPAVVLADEPTANLDSETSLHIIGVMRELNEKDNITFIFSTHDSRLLMNVKRLVRIEDGKIVKNSQPEVPRVI